MQVTWQCAVHDREMKEGEKEKRNRAREVVSVGTHAQEQRQADGEKVFNFDLLDSDNSLCRQMSIGV